MTRLVTADVYPLEILLGHIAHAIYKDQNADHVLVGHAELLANYLKVDSGRDAWPRGGLERRDRERARLGHAQLHGPLRYPEVASSIVARSGVVAADLANLNGIVAQGLVKSIERGARHGLERLGALGAFFRFWLGFGSGLSLGVEALLAFVDLQLFLF